MCNDFREVIDSSPRSLVEAGLYGHLAIEWRQGIHLAVSMRLVAKALGAQTGGQGYRHCVRNCCPGRRTVVGLTSQMSSRLEDCESSERGQHGMATIMLTGQQKSDGVHSGAVESGIDLTARGVHDQL